MLKKKTMRSKRGLRKRQKRLKLNYKPRKRKKRPLTARNKTEMKLRVI